MVRTLTVGLICLLLLLGRATAQTVLDPEWQVTEFVTGLSTPANGIAYVCEEDVFYISEYGANQVRKVHPNGSTEIVFSVAFPDELAISPDGNWMAVKTHSQGPITIYDMRKKEILTTLPIGGSMATGVVWDQQDNLLFARMVDANYQLVMFTQADIRAGGEPGVMLQTLTAMEGMRFDAAGKLYIAGHQHNLIMVVGEGYKSIEKEIPGVSDPIMMDFDPITNSVFVSHYISGGISYIKRDGSVTNLAGDLKGPYGLAFDCDGNLYVNEFNGGRILKFSRKQAPVAKCSCVKDCSEYPCDFGGVLMCHYNHDDPFMSETVCVQPNEVAERRQKYGDTCGPCQIHN